MASSDHNLHLDIPIWTLVQDRGEETGHRYGYSTMITQLCTALEEAGVIVDHEAPVRLSIPSWPDDYDCDKEIWSFGMWEFPFMPPSMLEKYNANDFVIVPGDEIKSFFIQAGVTKPIFSCPLGVDESFTYQHRHYYKTAIEPFTFLWLGAHTQRKMGKSGLQAFRIAFHDDMEVLLHYKTSKWGYHPAEKLIARVGGNMIVDKRCLSREDLLKVYYNSHCLIHTCPMEGFGLPPAEAMATGCLVIAPSWSGLKAFINPETAIIMETMPHKMRVTDKDKDTGELMKWDVDTIRPHRKKLSDQLRWIVDHYNETESIRRTGSDFIRERFRWPLAAERIIELITKNSRRLNHGRNSFQRAASRGHVTEETSFGRAFSNRVQTT